MSPDLQRRLLFILHHGLVESRLLAQSNKTQQLFDLVDTLEPIPACIADWREDHHLAIRSNLEAYESKYPDAFRYVEFLDKTVPPLSF